ncbi:unnamed protein product [Rotaria sp. Silwood2]|nr:unnamed protein product [Rotaria sp. Silwood2]CAF3132928.1 unnamed protein product [Rotaria sp. Silwood2]CAF4386678.1 unnamed protein product [Rotaria sp. Silwood2]CAF4445774.1 unnamed protein product [Rotaria sp. Silwood2]
MNRSSPINSDRLKYLRRCQRKRKLSQKWNHGLSDLPDMDDCNENCTASVSSSQRLMNVEQLDVERPIVPELITSYNESKTFVKGNSVGCPMIQKWRDQFLGKGKRLEGNEWHVVDAARQGLIKVGKAEKCAKKVLDRINKEFNRIKGQSRGKIVMYCIRLYTRNVFVNRVVNRALCNEDESYLEGLGPFCYLLTLHIYAPTTPAYNGTVYRGCSLESSAIEKYRQAIGQGPVKWLGFTSTSKSSIVARYFSDNVIFKITLTNFSNRFQYGRPVDISHLSEMDQEDEDLLSPGIIFTVESIEENLDDGCTYIHIYAHGH